MKIIIAGALTLAAFAALHLPILKKKKGIILVLYAMGMILFFAVYNVRTLKNITRFHHPYLQVVYQKAFFEDKEYPDAFLDEFFKDKTHIQFTVFYKLSLSKIPLSCKDIFLQFLI